ncbi:MAG TPA: hypothetical protein VN841_06760, partial [Bryobacteraceae bacterium]|nr:hypothetical protein [Bryobacteraceae bacterium]
GQHLELANSNFAEVGNGTRNLISDGAKTTLQSPDQEVDQRSTSEFRLKEFVVVPIPREVLNSRAIRDGFSALARGAEGPFCSTWWPQWISAVRI